jgi:hypothetical protein
LEVEAFIQRHPRLFHMAEAGAWPGIQRDGLLSTTALLDLFEYSGDERLAIESQRRSSLVTIVHKRTGAGAVIRDNIPLREQFLAECLTDMTPQEWYELLNRKTFFWVSEERLETLLRARAYRSRPHDVITLDTRALAERELDRITLAPINTGATLYPTASPRGTDTFKTVVDYPLEDRVRWRGAKDAIIELAVDYELQNIEELALLVQRRQGNEALETLWSRGP